MVQVGKQTTFSFHCWDIKLSPTCFKSIDIEADEHILRLTGQSSFGPQWSCDSTKYKISSNPSRFATNNEPLSLLRMFSRLASHVKGFFHNLCCQNTSSLKQISNQILYQYFVSTLECQSKQISISFLNPLDFNSRFTLDYKPVKRTES